MIRSPSGAPSSHRMIKGMDLVSFLRREVRVAFAMMREGHRLARGHPAADDAADETDEQRGDAPRAPSPRTTSGVGAGCATAAPNGDTTSPPYQPPNAFPAPAASSTTSSGVATSHAIVPCRIVRSEWRAPVIFPATQPPITKLKNAEQMIMATSMRVIVVNDENFWTDVAPTAVPISPKISAAVSAASAPTQTALQLTLHATHVSGRE